MDYQVALLVFGILLLLVGLVGKVRAKGYEIGAKSKLVRIILTVVGVALVLVSFNPDTLNLIYDYFIDNPPDTTISIESLQDMKSLNGEYTIQQKKNARFVDAHENKNNDYRLVTRNFQDNSTQKWIFSHLGNNVYRIQQKNNERYVDAYENDKNDFAVVTRNSQNDDTQKWLLTPLGNDTTYIIQQMSNKRYLDAYLNSERDYMLVTRDRQDDDTQKWIIKPCQDK